MSDIHGDDNEFMDMFKVSANDFLGDIWVDVVDHDIPGGSIINPATFKRPQVEWLVPDNFHLYMSFVRQL